jgi:hypothetical protein
MDSHGQVIEKKLFSDVNHNFAIQNESVTEEVRQGRTRVRGNNDAAVVRLSIAKELSSAKGQTPITHPTPARKASHRLSGSPPTGLDSAGGCGGRIANRMVGKFSLAGVDGRTPEARGSTCLLVEVFADIFPTMVLSQDSQIFKASPAMDAFTKYSCSTE